VAGPPNYSATMDTMDARPVDSTSSLTPEILAFLSPFSEEIRELTRALRAVVLVEASGALELVYDAYNAVAMGYTFTGRPGDAFCHVAVYSRWVNLGFNYGAELPDPDGLLQGTGRRVRHVRITKAGDIDEPHIRGFLREAAARARGFGDVSAATEPQSIVRAVYPKRRRPSQPDGQEEP
jgi:hypothetical protein